MTIHPHTILFILFVCFILGLPLNSLNDTIAFFHGNVGDKTVPQTPVYLKLFKDIFLLSSIVLVAWHGGLRFIKRELTIYYGFLLLVFGFAACAIAGEMQLPSVLAVRSYLIIFFIFLGYYFYDFDSDRLYPFLRFILVVEVVIQVFQFFYAPSYYGGEFYGFNTFNPGTFLIPSTMASYAIVVLYYARTRNDSLTSILAMFSIFMSKSTTGWIVVITYYLVVFAKQRRLAIDVLLTMIVLGGVVIFLNLDAITGRENLADNLATRWEIFVSYFTYPFGKGFGLGTGAAVLSQIDDAVIADSTAASLLINFGWIGIIIYVFFVYQAYKAFHYDTLLMIAFICFSLTMIIFEMTPFIQFVFFEWGRRLGEQRHHFITKVQHL